MNQQRSVVLLQNSLADLNSKVRPDAEDVRIESPVVELAQSEAVRHPRLTFRVPVRKNVGGVEQLGVAELAYGTALPIGFEHTDPEALLV